MEYNFQLARNDSVNLHFSLCTILYLQKESLKGQCHEIFDFRFFFHESVSPKPWVGSSYFPRSLCFLWFWFGLEITRMYCCPFKKLYTQSLETIPLKVEWMDFWKEICKNLFFNIEFSQNLCGQAVHFVLTNGDLRQREWIFCSSVISQKV